MATFWLYARTQARLKQERVLRVGFPSADRSDRLDWYTIPEIVPNTWQQIRVPFTLDVNWKQVLGVRFYVAEGWYEDGDSVDFFIDDMQLGRYTEPRFADCTVSSRVLPRGTGIEAAVSVRGPWQGTSIRCLLPNQPAAASPAMALDAPRQVLRLSWPGIEPGGHRAVLQLLGDDGRIVDRWEQYLRVLSPQRTCYLKLITFYTKPIARCDPEALAVLNDSAYDGVAIPLCGSYDTGPVPTAESLGDQADAIRKALTKDPWPWVALNRLIAAPEDARGHSNAEKHAADIDYFRRIRGLDLNNETGARADFLALWETAVRLARQWKSPGVMIDLEAYNNYRAYHVPYVAEARGESVDTVIAECERLGADMAAIVAREYPKCIVWSLFSRLEKTVSLPGENRTVLTTPSYITLGMLKAAKTNNIPLKYLCGGETTPGYCNKTVEQLKAKIAARDRDVAPYLEAYPDHFFLAGTISPFHDYAIVTSFIEKGYQGSGMQTIEDFEEHFRILFNAYDWVWIYASSAAKTLPYNPENSQRYSTVYRKALSPADPATKRP
jgi:hypothetical protein